MAKTDKADAKKAGKGKTKAGKPKLPKSIGGMKIPKDLRKDGEKLIALLKHPLVAEMAVAGALAFAEGMRDKRKPRAAETGSGDAAETRRNTGKTLGELGEVAAIIGTALAARANKR